MKLKPGFAQNRVTDGPDVQISQWLSHVWSEDEKVYPKTQRERKKWISECSKSTGCKSCWSKELVQIFLPNFARVGTGFPKIVYEPWNRRRQNIRVLEKHWLVRNLDLYSYFSVFFQTIGLVWWIYYCTYCGWCLITSENLFLLQKFRCKEVWRTFYLKNIFF